MGKSINNKASETSGLFKIAQNRIEAIRITAKRAKKQISINFILLISSRQPIMLRIPDTLVLCELDELINREFEFNLK